MNLFRFLENQSRRVLTGLTLFLVFLLGFIDYVTGFELLFAIFYLVPVAMAAWFVSKWSAFLISILSAVVWFLADFESQHVFTYAVIHYWNAAVMLGFFLIVSYILGRWKEASEQELMLARDIQEGFLPSALPEIQGYEVATVFRPSLAVSGDYFYVLKFDEEHMGLCVADVIGHGVPAALLMSNLQAAFRIFAPDVREPGQLCARLNRTICNNITPGKFITLFYMLLNARQRAFAYCNAGNNPPILLRNDGSHTFLETGGPVLGVLADAAYEQSDDQLQPGDLLVLFTDGVIEATNAFGEQFGVQRLMRLLEEHRDRSVGELKDVILKKVTDFSNGMPDDDVTLLLLAVR